MKMQLHDKLEKSACNGPGSRAVVWFQGCNLGCPGCFNPQTHTFEGGSGTTPRELVDWIKSCEGIEGVSFSGGEPLLQPEALIETLKLLRAETELSLLIFTGFYLHEIEKRAPEIPGLVDVLIAGRYNPKQHNGKALLGSVNQTIHLPTDRYTLADFENIPQHEILIRENGEVILSGVNPVKLDIKVPAA